MLRSEFPWRGRLRFDRPRQRDFLRLPLDYPRINQFPEWFVIEADRLYAVNGQRVASAELYGWELEIPAGGEIRLAVRPECATVRRRQASCQARETLKYLHPQFSC